MHRHSSLLATLLANAAATPISLAGSPVAKPSEQQLAWQDLEVGAIVHWNLQTLCTPKSSGRASSQKCQASSRTLGQLYVPSMEAVAEWDPSNLDTDEWAKTAASFGATYVVMVVDHMTGFTWFDTAFHNFSIAHTKYKGGGGDVLREFIASCRKYGLKTGFFYSVHFNWFLGVDGYHVGHPPLGGKNYTNEEYMAVAKGQLREVAAAFGDEGPVEMWFDGGVGPHAADLAPLLMEIAPRAVCHSCFSNFTEAGPVRWMGNEQGMMPLPSWGAADGDGHAGSGGDPHGAGFMPPSTDIVLREHYWFHQDNTEQYTKSTLRLVHDYLTSVGRASNLIMDMAPDGTGAVPASDVKRYGQMGRAIDCLFSQRLAGTDGPLRMAGGGAIEWHFSAVSSKNVSLVLREDQRDGQLIGSYSIECRDAATGHYSACQMGSIEGVIPAELYPGIGHKRVLMLAPTAPVDGLRLTVKSHYATGQQVPTLRDITLFDWGGAVEQCVEDRELDPFVSLV